MKNVRFLQNCEDSSEFAAAEVSEAFLNAVQHVSPISKKGEVIAFRCVSKFREGQELSVPDSMAAQLEELNIVEVVGDEAD